MAYRFAVNCSILFPDLPLEQRARAAAGAGFSAVEFWWPWPVAVPAASEVDAFVASIRSAGVDLVALNLFGGDLAAGDRGVMAHPGRVQEFRSNVALVVDIARRTGCRSFNALYGRRLPGVPASEQDDVAFANLVHAASSVAGIGGTVLLEPLSGIPGYPLLTADDDVDLVRRCRAAGHDNVRLLLDTFHLAANGADPAAVLEQHGDVVGHVQVADHPGRHEPGTAALAPPAFLRALDARGWTRFVALEYVPSAPGEAAFGWLPRSERTGRPDGGHAGSAKTCRNTSSGPGDG